jgi:hypothetical protein
VPTVQPHEESDGSSSLHDHGGDDDAGDLRTLVAVGEVIRRHTPLEVDGIKAKIEEFMGMVDTERIDTAIAVARRSRNRMALVTALEDKIRLLVSPTQNCFDV